MDSGTEWKRAGTYHLECTVDGVPVAYTIAKVFVAGVAWYELHKVRGGILFRSQVLDEVKAHFDANVLTALQRKHEQA